MISELLIGGVLTGGMSRRMGRDKATLPLADGRAMGQVVAEALGGLCARVVSLGPSEGMPPGAGAILDERPGLGPLGGVHALVTSGLGARYLICPCDLPLVTPQALRGLAEATLEGALGATYADRGAPRGRMHFPMVLAAAASAPLERYLQGGGRSVGGFLQAIDALRIPLDAALRGALAGANTPEGLATLLGEGQT